jgi:hypothetical protein
VEERVYCELFLIKEPSADHFTVIFGFSQGHQTAASQWYVEECSTLSPVSIARAVLESADADRLFDQLTGTTSFSLDVVRPTPGQIKVRGTSRVRRPPILRHPRIDAKAFDASFNERLCEVTELWNLDKEAVIRSIVAGDKTEAGGQRRVDEVVTLIADRVGADFKTRAAAALGNFEVFTIRPRIHRVRCLPRGIEVEIDAAFADDQCSVAVVLQNGRVTTHASLKQWKRGSGDLQFSGEEPFSTADVSVFDASGKLIDHGLHIRLTRVGLKGEMIVGHKKVRDPWSRLVQQKAGKRSRSKLERVDHVDQVGFTMSSEVGEAEPDEPWQPLSVSTLLLAERETGCYFLPKASAEDEVSRFETIRKLFDSSDVTRVICVDPYFDKRSLALLARVRNRCRVEVLTHAPIDAVSEMATLLRQKPTLVSQALSVHRTASDFHDRFLVVERSVGRDVFVLSNSFLPVGPTDPIVVIKATGEASLQIWDYIDGLRNGAVSYWPEPRTASTTQDDQAAGELVASILGGAGTHPKEVVAQLGPALWSKLGTHFATAPDVATLNRVLSFLGGHACPSEDYDAIESRDRRRAAESALLAVEGMIGSICAPWIPRNAGDISLEAWIAILRALTTNTTSSPVEAAIEVGRSGYARYQVEYGLNLGLQLLAAWDQKLFVALIERHLQPAAIALTGMHNDEDPTLSRPVAVGAAVLRELMAFVGRSELLEALFASSLSYVRRLAVVALFSDHGRQDRIRRALELGAAPEDVLWASLLRGRGDSFVDENSWFDEVCCLFESVPEERLPAILKRAGVTLAKRVGERLEATSHARSVVAYAFVHSDFEQVLLRSDLEQFYVGETELERLQLASTSVLRRQELEGFDAVAHVEAVARKAARRSWRCHLPRLQAVNYYEWLGGIRLAELAADYLANVVDVAALADADVPRVRRCAELLLDIIRLRVGRRSDSEPNDALAVAAGLLSELDTRAKAEA